MLVYVRFSKGRGNVIKLSRVPHVHLTIQKNINFSLLWNQRHISYRMSSYLNNCIARLAFLSLLLYCGSSTASFLWFEKVPNTDDPCVITVTE